MDENDFARMEELMGRFRGEIIEAFDQRLGVMEESVQHRLDLLVEGQQLLAEKLEVTRVELKADIAKVDHRLTVVEARLSQRLDGVAADLAAHRHDTEAHQPGWKVRE